jgi:hypothetical protein
MIMNPPKWPNVYPQGTKAGSEEHEFFKALARHPKFAWRSVAAISKESGLSKERVEEIIYKYFKKGMIFSSPKNDKQWGYWERVPEMLEKDKASIAQEDQKSRIDDAMNCKISFELMSIPEDQLPICSGLSDDYIDDPLLSANQSFCDHNEDRGQSFTRPNRLQFLHQA